MPVLLYADKAERNCEFPFEKRVVIGRGPTCDLRLDDEHASRTHAMVYEEAGAYFLKDLESRNGTRLNGERVLFAHLAFGDEIRVGHTRIFFVQTAPSAMVGQSVGGYSLVELLGAGGMGIVFRARRQGLKQDVALKVLHPRRAGDEKLARLFVEQAETTAKLFHPNLVNVQAAGRDKLGCYYAMDLVGGPSAARLLARLGALDPLPAVEFANHIASALAYLHEHGLVHADVKPGNFLLDSDATAKLGDLALARPVPSGPRPADFLPNGREYVWGTPAYISPEVAIGQPPTPASDLYSLGASLFHLLVGKPPFGGSTSDEVLNRHLTEPLPDLRALRPDLPAGIPPLVERLTAKQPERRHASVQDLLAELRTIREQLRGGQSGEPLAEVLERWRGGR